MMRFLGTLSALALSSSIGILHAYLTPAPATPGSVTPDVVIEDVNSASARDEEALPADNR